MSKRTKLRDRVLPMYSKGEEVFHMVSHTVGGGLAIAALVLCVVVAYLRDNPWGIASGIVYGSTMVILYTCSSIYHGLTPPKPKKIFQIIDHCAIFFLIAGTYTPIALGRFREVHPYIAWILFALMWAACALGTALTAVDLRKFRVFSMIVYIAMGWTAVFIAAPLLDAINGNGFALLIAGGIAYTIGSALYGLGKRLKWMHSVFHILVVAGTVLHFLCIVIYVL